jgi:small subunit ribosomal protein S17
MAKCEDKNCFRHGTINTRGTEMEGEVVSDRGKRTVIVERPTLKYIAKYKRYARTHSRIPAHNPECIGAKTGDRVRIAECRKISKTKAWTVVEILKREEK